MTTHFFSDALVLTGAPERKKAMRHAQPQHDSLLHSNEVPDGVLVGQTLAGDQAALSCILPIKEKIQGGIKLLTN